MTGTIVGILLAAGQSTRFGDNKLLHPLTDSRTPIAAQSANHLLRALPDSIAVVREDDLRLKLLLIESGIHIIENPHAKLGMGSSIRWGIEAANNLFPDSRGWVIALADMPYITADIIKQVADAIQAGKLLAAPQYQQQRGHPVGFSHQLYDELLLLHGDSGAKSLLNKYSSQLYTFETSSNVILYDVDRPADLDKIKI